MSGECNICGDLHVEEGCPNLIYALRNIPIDSREGELANYAAEEIERLTDLVKRAALSSISRNNDLPWVNIKKTFVLGSTSAKVLCKHLGIDSEDRSSIGQ
jgi:hypothetical protein